MKNVTGIGWVLAAAFFLIFFSSLHVDARTSPERAANVRDSSVPSHKTKHQNMGTGKAAATVPGAGGAQTQAASTSPAGKFRFGVWLQNPLETFTDEETAETFNSAQGFKDIGVTDWVGMYVWPSEEPPTRFAGYNALAAQKLRDVGFMGVIAGEDQSAIDWVNNNPQYADIFTGYLAGDEPDMKKQSPWNPYGNVEDLPENFKERCRILWEGDGTRDVYANFGKPFGRRDESYYETGPSIEDDFANYTYYLTLASDDFYGITDPWSPYDPVTQQGYVGVWVYGETMKTMRYYRSRTERQRPPVIWGFVETGSPFQSASDYHDHMPPELILPCVMNLIANKAEGIIWFVHDFLQTEPPLPPPPPRHPLKNHLTRQAVKNTADYVNSFAAVLNTPILDNVTATTDGDVDVSVRENDFGEDKWLVAMDHGNWFHIEGQAVNATFTVPDGGNRVVEVFNENRSISMVDGVFTDHFDPNQWHIYKIPGLGSESGPSASGGSSLKEKQTRFIPCSNPKDPSRAAMPKICFETGGGLIDLQIINHRSGQVIRHLTQGQREAGRIDVIWDGKNDSDQKIASGVYTAVLTVNDSSRVTSKVVIAK